MALVPWAPSVSAATNYWDLLKDTYYQAKAVYPYAKQAYNYLKPAKGSGAEMMQRHTAFKHVGRRDLPYRRFRVNRGAMGRYGLNPSIPRGPNVGFLRSGGLYRYAVGLSQLKWLNTFDIDFTPVPNANFAKENIVKIPQDTTPNGRIGNRVCIKKIEIRGKVDLPGSTVITAQTDDIWVFVLQDMQTNGAGLASTDFLEQVAGAPVATLAFRNLEQTMRFKVLWQKRIHIFNDYNGGPAVDSSGDQSKNYHAHVKCNVVIDYNGVLGLTTEMRSNSLWICAGSTHNKIGSKIQVRVRYEDLNR